MSGLALGEVRENRPASESDRTGQAGSSAPVGRNIQCLLETGASSLCKADTELKLVLTMSCLFGFLLYQ